MFTNENRIDSVTDIVNQFAVDLDMHNEDGETIVTDLIANLLHWVANDTGNREAPLTVAAHALGNYITESYIEYDTDKPENEQDVVGPDANVWIGVDCNDEHWSYRTGGEPAVRSQKR